MVESDRDGGKWIIPLCVPQESGFSLWESLNPSQGNDPGLISFAPWFLDLVPWDGAGGWNEGSNLLRFFVIPTITREES